MKLTYLTLIFSFFVCIYTHGQISAPDTPKGIALFDNKDQPHFIKMPEIDFSILLKEDKLNDNIAGIPWRFGHTFEVNITPEDSGIWHMLENGDKLWQLGISSKGAISLNLVFSRYILPDRATLFIYSANKTHILGAFTSYNNQEDYYFATTLIKGDSIIVEYYEPYDVAYNGELAISAVTHGYRDPFHYIKTFGQSGSCNINVACHEAENWQDQVNSTVMLLTGSNSFCSGVIINNSDEDYTPYILSANHCYRDPSTIVAWFNWQSPDCENPEHPPSYNSMSGAKHKAKNSATDFWLFKLNQPIPKEYDPYFAGWNRTNELFIGGLIAGIHHPRGDIKKFSYSDNGTIATSYMGNSGSGSSHWKVFWSGGTTEPGSSGSPLFDSNGKIIGQLHGGYAACGNNSPDWYGRLGASWGNGWSAVSGLKSWLDPSNTGVFNIPGMSYNSNTVKDPRRFKAVALSYSDVLVTWIPNAQQNKVLLAYNTDNAFGIPQGPYKLGDEIEGGGKIIYIGNDNCFIHQELETNTEYHYKAWSFQNSLDYSDGVYDSSITFCDYIYEFPFLENFNSGKINSCWQQEILQGSYLWELGQGNNMNIPENPYSGDFNLLFKPQDNLSIAKLIIPQLSFSDYDYGTISFYFTNPAEVNQDVMEVLYRKCELSEWEVLEIFNLNVTEWTLSEIFLPEVSETSQIAFKGYYMGGNGICIDNIEIKGHYNVYFPSPRNLRVYDTGDHTAHLKWEVPHRTYSKAEFFTYKIYRDEVFIAYTNDVNEFIDSGLPTGSYEYFITAAYHCPAGESVPSNPVNVTIKEINPVLITVEATGHGQTNPETGTHIYNKDAIVSFTAYPEEHWIFSHFETNHDTLSLLNEFSMIINNDTVIKSVFVEKEYILTLFSDPGNVGIQTGGGPYKYGDAAKVSTTQPHGYSFLFWKDEEKIIATKRSFDFLVKQDIILTAVYEQSLFNIIANGVPPDGGSVWGGGYYSFGKEITLKALPRDGWSFMYWEKDNNIVSYDTVYPIIVTSGLSINALFEKTTTSNLQLNEVKNIVVYPNPAYHAITIEGKASGEKTSIEIFNLQGQKVYNNNVLVNNNFFKHIVQTSQIKPGLYFLHISIGNTTHKRKIIIIAKNY